VIRYVGSRPDSIFLTFDDGPDGDNTARVLDLLKARDAKATFFLIANKIRGQEPLVERMVREGHALGNHSWDHRYRNYFRGSQTIQRWVTSAADEFRRAGLPEPVGFRPPAGIVTPLVKKALRELNEPMVLWNERFYDSVRPWTPEKARRSVARLSGGSVVLLHDRRRVGCDSDFFATLELYIDQLQAHGFKLEPLTRAICEGGVR
jgi:peptidoglycan/xylan/chitin deacetylase (PgdA/CDA1 family)